MVLDIIALIFSAAALGFSIFVYIRHDKRLKPLELEIAQHQVNEIREQEAAKDIASLDALSRYVRPGNLYVTVTNNGKAPASDIQVEVLENANKFPLLSSGILPYSCLPSGHSFELRYMVYDQSPSIIRIRVQWNDSTESKKSQIFDLQAK